MHSETPGQNNQTEFDFLADALKTGMNFANAALTDYNIGDREAADQSYADAETTYNAVLWLLYGRRPLMMNVTQWKGLDDRLLQLREAIDRLGKARRFSQLARRAIPSLGNRVLQLQD
jgi:hypothetical protein